MHTMGKFLLELCLPDYSMLEFHPSLLAAAALYLAMQVYHSGDWVCMLVTIVVELSRVHTPHAFQFCNKNIAILCCR